MNAYRKLIQDIDPNVDATGVEAHMRLQYSTLDHLDAATFRAEIALAKRCEEAEPGYLQTLAIDEQRPEHILPPGHPPGKQPVHLARR